MATVQTEGKKQVHFALFGFPLASASKKKIFFTNTSQIF